MTMGTKILILILSTLGILWVSRASLRNPRTHGFYRFFAWVAILVLFLVNMDAWFLDPISPVHLFSWLFLTISLLLICLGVQLFRTLGKLDQARDDSGLVGIEKTTTLVTAGIYHYIRHPFYSSLLFLSWGILLKRINWISILLAGIATILLLVTARKEEAENIEYFGEEYRAYMAGTKMFIPFIY